MKQFLQKLLDVINPARFTVLYFLAGGIFVSYKHDLVSFLPNNAYLPKSTNLFIDFSILVATTAIFHVFLINLKSYGQAEIQNNKQFLKNKLTYLSWVFIILLLIPLVNLGIYRHQVPKVEFKTYDSLEAIASIEVQQLKRWLDYRVADAHVLASDQQFANKVDSFLGEKDHAGAKEIQTRFDAILNSYHYESITLLNAAGKPVLQAGGNYDAIALNNGFIDSVRSSHQVQHGDFFIDPHQSLNLQILAPITVSKGRNSDLLAFVLIQTGFYHSILPSLQMWPTKSTSSDAMLVKKDASNLVIVDATPNDINGQGIHHIPATADTLYNLNKKLSLGKNLLGKMAFSANIPITGTSWYFVTEVAQDEVMAGLDNLLFWTSFAALIALAIISTVLYLLWKQQKSAYRLALDIKDIELNKLLDKFHSTPFVGTGTVNATTRKWSLVNQRLCDIFGYSAQELTCLKYIQLNHPDDVETDNAFYAKLKSGEISHYMREKRFIHKSGKLIHAHVEITAIRNDYDEIETIVVAVEDITERVAAELALKASEERLDLVVRGSHDGWWDLDLITNTASHSDRWWSMLGYDVNMDNYDSLHWQTLTHPDDIERTLTYLRKILATKNTLYELELRLRHKVGHYVPVLTRGYILRDKNGKAVRISGTNTDITEFKKTDREIITLNRLLSMITNTNQLITRKPGSVVLFNEVCKIAVKEGGFNFAWVGLLTQDKNQLKCITYAGLSTSFIESLDHNLQNFDYRIPAIQCITEGQYIICNDLEHADYEEHWVASALESGYRSMVALPIAQYGKVVGNFSLFSDEPQAFNDKEISLLDELAADISFALEIEDSENQRKKTEKALTESEALFHNLASNSPGGIFRTDKKGHLIYYNEIWQKITAATEDELKTRVTFTASIHPEDSKAVIATFQRSLINKNAFDMEYRFIHPNHETLWVKSQAQPSHDDKGDFNGFVGQLTDITELKSVQESLYMAGVVLDNSRESILVTDHNAKVLMVNKAFSLLEGYTPEEIMGKNPNILNSGKHDKGYFTNMYTALKETGVFQSEIWNRRKDGEVHPGMLSITAVKNAKNKITNYVSVFTDITSLKNTEERLAFLANHDALTGLPNRMMLISHISHAVEGAKRNGKQLALLLLDLDRFKNINDSFGHLAGDDLLQQLATRLKTRLRGNDMIARLGGDEFVILLEDVNQPEYAAKVAENIIATVEEPWLLHNQSEVYVGTSIGISLYPDHGDNALELLKHADAALYQAKGSGRGVAKYYSETLTRQARRRFKLEARLREAINHDELRLHYQPKLDIFSGEIVGVEALARWVDPKIGMIMPNEFIGIAEETGLITKLGEWVLQEACQQGRIWLDKGINLTVAVNLSATQLYHSDISKIVRDILKTTGFPAQNLELELTESILMSRESESIKKLYQIKELGISLAVDDFGAGYSSLAYLRRFPLDVLKIDRSFVADLEDDKDDRAITATIIAIGRTLNLKVIAEGVETESQLTFLESHGCHMYQGFYASPPLEPKLLEEFLMEYKGHNVFA
ncbi:MAG: EAL domain-containing protein [Methylotenera sp.]|nr:EAL domain-containing protein [Methylotenera sp.]